jgi:flavin-dependent dehydrogenase
MRRGAAAGEFDVVVLGAGPAGCAAALALAQNEVGPILLVAPAHDPDFRVGESVPPDIRISLDELGLWDEFLHERHEACLGSCASWGTAALGYNDFLFNPLGPGWHLDRARFDQFLLGNAIERGIDVCDGMRFDAAQRLPQGGFRLRLAGDETRIVDTRFVVDATGPRACFARSQGARRDVLDQLLCAVGFFALPDPTRFSRLTMLEAVEYGWWYAAKLPNARLAVVAASDPRLIKQTALHSRDGFLAHLAATTHIAAGMSGGRLIEEALLTCSAPSFLLDPVVGDGWLAVGDAACAFDPISSQGIHKALADGRRAGKAIADHLRGREGALPEYQSSIAARFAQYRRSRAYFYELEKRWPASPFWKKRGPTTVARDREENTLMHA